MVLLREVLNVQRFMIVHLDIIIMSDTVDCVGISFGIELSSAREKLEICFGPKGGGAC